MGGTSGGTTVIQPATPAPPTAGQSAAEYAAALPSILQAQLQYQPQFAQADYENFARLAPQYTAVYDAINKQYYPQTYGLQEQLAKQASEAASAQDLPDWMKKQYRDEVNAQLGTNVNAPIGADYVSRGLINQAQQYRQYYQNLGLSLAGRQPLTSAQYQQPSFNVADQFAQNYNTQMGGYGSYAAASRPIARQMGTPNWIPAMQAAGNVIGTIGAGMAMGCWVAAEIYGGWNKPETEAARHYINHIAPAWFRNLYMKHGKAIAKFISNKPILKAILRPIFDMFGSAALRRVYGIKTV